MNLIILIIPKISPDVKKILKFIKTAGQARKRNPGLKSMSRIAAQVVLKNVFEFEAVILALPKFNFCFNIYKQLAAIQRLDRTIVATQNRLKSRDLCI